LNLGLNSKQKPSNPRLQNPNPPCDLAINGLQFEGLNKSRGKYRHVLSLEGVSNLCLLSTLQSQEELEGSRDLLEVSNIKGKGILEGSSIDGDRD
jgi:hypothetical protein